MKDYLKAPVQWFLCSFLFLLSCPVSRADNVAVFLALDADLKILKQTTKSAGQATVVGTKTIHRFEIGEHRVYAVIMGSGTVESAVSAESLLARHRCDFAFSIGPAGGLKDAAQVGSWWAVERCFSADKSAGRGSASQHHQLPIPTASENWKVPTLFDKAQPAVLASGEGFIASQGSREKLANAGAALVDMNTHGLAVACANHEVPLYVWRVVSDLADESAAEHFQKFVASYEGGGAKALVELIQALPANPKAAKSYPGIRRLSESGSDSKAPD